MHPPVPVQAPVQVPAWVRARVRAGEAEGEAPDGAPGSVGRAELLTARLPLVDRDPPTPRGRVRTGPRRRPVPLRPRAATVQSEAMLPAVRGAQLRASTRLSSVA